LGNKASGNDSKDHLKIDVVPYTDTKTDVGKPKQMEIRNLNI